MHDGAEQRAAPEDSGQGLCSGSHDRDPAIELAEVGLPLGHCCRVSSCALPAARYGLCRVLQVL